MKPRAEEEFREPTPERVRERLGAMVGRRVLVVGDSALDAYVSGEVERISPEAPVPVLAVEREELLLGGAANVAKCLVALGARPTLCTVVGDDADGELFRTEAENLGILGVGSPRPRACDPQDADRRAPAAGDPLDRETSGCSYPRLVKRSRCGQAREVKRADAIILSDHSKGALGSRSAAPCSPRGRCRVLVDPLNRRGRPSAARRC